MTETRKPPSVTETVRQWWKRPTCCMCKYVGVHMEDKKGKESSGNVAYPFVAVINVA